MAWVYNEDYKMWYNPDTDEWSGNSWLPNSYYEQQSKTTTPTTTTPTPPPATTAPKTSGGNPTQNTTTKTGSGTVTDPMGNRYLIYTPGNWNIDKYVARNPELKAHWDSNPGLQAHYKGDFKAWAQNHYYSLPVSERSKWWPEPAPSSGGKGGGGGGGGGGEGGTDFGGYQGNINDLISGERSNINDLLSGARSNINDLINAFDNPIREEAYALAKEQIAYASRRLKEIEAARKLLNKTGTLSAEETTLFNDMEAAAVANLKANVRDETQDVWDTALADLVNKGVLQGTVGSMILGEIASEEVKTVAEGVNNIRIAKNTDMLNMIQGNKNLALQYDTLYANEGQNLLGTGQNYANAALQADLNKLGLGVGAELDLTGLGVNSNLDLTGLGVNSNLTFAGLESAEGIAGQQMALSKILAQMQIDANATNLAMQLASQWNIAQLNAATQLQLGNLSANASTTASQYGMWGNFGLGLAGILSNYGGDWWKQFSSWMDKK